MPVDPVELAERTEAARTEAEQARRSVVPAAAGRSLWLAAAWTGAGAAVLCVVTSIVAVAICWLPASGASGNAGSAIRAGVLVFLAALHAGITLDGVPAAFVPLGMTVLVGAVAWRAGCGLADVADERGEQRPALLARVAATQIGVFAAVCGVAALFVRLGTTTVSTVPAMVTGALLFAVTGGVAFVRWSSLGDAMQAWVAPGTIEVLRRSARAAAAGVACYLGVAALFVAGALVVHHGRVEALSAQVGGGWSGAPVLLLGVLAAPNAVIAATAYLAGPGFAVGSGTHVSLFTTAHGVLPAFPVLGAVPSGAGAGWPVLAMAAATPLLAGSCVAALVLRTPGWAARLRDVAVAALLVGMCGLVLAWQGGGGVGNGRLKAVGASPWQLGIAMGGEVAVLGTVSLGVAALAGALRRRWKARHPDQDAEPGPLRAALQVVRTAVAAAQPTTPIAVPDEAPATVDPEADDADPVAAKEPVGETEPVGDGEPVDPDEVTVKLGPDELAG